MYVLQVFSDGSFYFYNSSVLNSFKKLNIYKKDFKSFKFYNKKKNSLKNVLIYNDLKYRNKFFYNKLNESTISSKKYT